jgi:hypothetical protein
MKTTKTVSQEGLNLNPGLAGMITIRHVTDNLRIEFDDVVLGCDGTWICR